MDNNYDSLYAPWTASGQKTRLSLLQRMNAEQVDEQTWREFFRKYSPFIIMMGKHMELSRDEIKELWSTVFLEINRKGINGYDREKGSFRSWFKALVKHRIWDVLRKRGPKKEVSVADIWAEQEDDISLSDDEEKSGALAENEDEYEKIWRKMLLYSLVLDLKDELNPIHFQAFFMVVLQGRKPQETAAVCGLKANTASQIVSRIRKTLHERFSQLQAENPLSSMSEEELMEKEAALYREYHVIEKEYAGLLD